MHGVIPFLKPPGITSHDAVGIVRRIVKEKRVGHSGTLDPMASGVLPIFVGRATRLIEYTESLSKTYVAEGCLGFSTDTEDSSGHCIEKDNDPTIPSWALLEEAIASFKGVIEQSPSKYSAIKVNGRRAYELAREGVDFSLPVRTIHIYDIELIAYAYPFFTIKVVCSAGTYIRALLRDIGLRLETFCTMTQLERTQAGSFSIEETITAEELMCKGELALYPCDYVLNHLPIYKLTEEETLAFVQGKCIMPTIDLMEGYQDGQLFRSYTRDGFMGISSYTKGRMKVEKNIFI